jgi:septal ring factor EnvC (AmiA/AmiB activator)
MKKSWLLLLGALFLFAINGVQAQTLSKAEKKALKKELKAYKKQPETYSNLKTQQKKEVKSLTEEITSVKSQLSDAQSENEELRAKLGILQAKYNDLITVSQQGPQLPNGTVYQVQMGYYEYLNLESFNKAMKYIKAEDADGAKRYIIGYFQNVEAALEFRKDIQTLGVKDAFVTQYIDGKRIMDFEAVKKK